MLIQYFSETPGHGMPAAPSVLTHRTFFFLGTYAGGREKLAEELFQQTEKQTEE